MHRLSVVLVLVAGALFAQAVSAKDDFTYSGFGSLVGGTVLQGDGYWARLPEAAGQYDTDLDLQTESRLGLQLRYQVTSQLSLTSQVLLRGINDFSPRLEWLYSSYAVTPNLSLSLGKMRLPVYHYSDVMDVGIAYPWLRVPTDAYSLAVTNFQGVRLQQNLDFGFATSKVQLYSGQQDTQPNKLLTTIEQYKTEQLYSPTGDYLGVRPIRTTKDYRDFFGVVVDTSISHFDLRVSYLTGRERFTLFPEQDSVDSPLGGEWTDTEFLDISFSTELDALFFIVEWNRYKNIYRSWFSSVVYQYAKFSPYLYYSRFEGVRTELGNPQRLDDKYFSIGLGLAYNIKPNLVLKFELTEFNDLGDAPVFIDKDRDGKTDARALAFSLDFSF
ncbi:hypothetical protein ACO1PK_05470 [Alishewanella sp. d11]|uniref:hypothetical protein n=1 Tax=Alishewanella sp. d11 TaxID=3414030 RepID=UPI003BF7CB0E